MEETGGKETHRGRATQSDDGNDRLRDCDDQRACGTIGRRTGVAGAIDDSVAGEDVGVDGQARDGHGHRPVEDV